MNIYTIILTAGVLSLIFTDLVRHIALKRKLTDVPNERSMHTIPTPRLGGIAILLVWFPGIWTLYITNNIDKQLLSALMCGLPIAFVSIVDDIKNIGSLTRLVMHFICVIAALYFLDFLRPFSSFHINISYPIIVYPLLVIGMVWFINLFNFMDGIDGIASIEAIYLALILFVFSGNLVTILLIACILGFLFWNFPKASIFLGDVGSTQLGFILIILGVYFHNDYSLSILNWIMIAAPFWFDATFTLYKRWRNKEKLGEAHKKHAYQRIVQYGFSHRRVLFVLILINTAIFVMILVYREFNFLKLPLTVLTIFGLYILYKLVDKRVPFNDINDR